MRYEIGQHGVGGNNESWYYAEYDEVSGKAYWVHEWSNMNHRLQTDNGEKKVELSDSVGKSFYADAIAIIKEKHPEWSAPKAE